MFSDIQNIRSASEPIKAEAVDSRLNNRKNKEGDDQKSALLDNESSEKTKDDALFAEKKSEKESVNRFSLDSLIYFLEDFLEESIALSTAQQDDERDNLGSGPKEKTHPVSTISPWLRSKHANANPRKSPSLSSQNADKRRNTIPPRYAAHAYAHRALSNGVSPPTQRRAKQPGAFGREAAHPLSSHDMGKGAEIGDVYDLIRALRTMKERGSTHLDVRDNAALLEGISAAIRKNTLS